MSVIILALLLAGIPRVAEYRPGIAIAPRAGIEPDSVSVLATIGKYGSVVVLATKIHLVALPGQKLVHSVAAISESTAVWDLNKSGVFFFGWVDTAKRDPKTEYWFEFWYGKEVERVRETYLDTKQRKE